MAFASRTTAVSACGITISSPPASLHTRDVGRRDDGARADKTLVRRTHAQEVEIDFERPRRVERDFEHTKPSPCNARPMAGISSGVMPRRHRDQAGSGDEIRAELQHGSVQEAGAGQRSATVRAQPRCDRRAPR